MAAQAHLCAGAAAHLLDQVDRAWEHYGQALGATSQQISGAERSGDGLSRPIGLDVLTTEVRSPRLKQAVDPSPDHLLRLRQARLVGRRDGREDLQKR